MENTEASAGQGSTKEAPLDESSLEWEDVTNADGAKYRIGRPKSDLEETRDDSASAKSSGQRKSYNVDWRVESKDVKKNTGQQFKRDTNIEWYQHFLQRTDNYGRVYRLVYFVAQGHQRYNYSFHTKDGGRYELSGNYGPGQRVFEYYAQDGGLVKVETT